MYQLFWEVYHSFRTQFYTSSIPNTLPDPDSWSSQANFPSSRVRCLPLTWLTLFLRWKQIEVWVKKSKEIQDEIQKLSEDLRWRTPLEDWGLNRFSETFISLSLASHVATLGGQAWEGTRGEREFPFPTILKNIWDWMFHSGQFISHGPYISFIQLVKTHFLKHNNLILGILVVSPKNTNVLNLILTNIILIPF